jgi:hypothetical protein
VRFLPKGRRLLLAGCCVWGASVSVAASPAPADAVPFQDQYQDGSLTFCNQAGQPITSGSLYTKPFVWTAVSSTPAPKGYKRADLVIFQPIQYVDPSGWDGYQMTVGAIFTNTAHPMAQATYADNPLLWPDKAYPPYWDGFYEVRMFFSSPNESEWSSTYPAAVIQVKGSTWTLARGGGGSCSVGKAVSMETYLLPKSETETPRTIVPSGAAGTFAAHSAAHPSTQGSGSKASSSTSAPKSQLIASGSTQGHGGGTSAGVIAIAAFVGLAVLGGVIALLSRRRGRFSGE